MPWSRQLKVWFWPCLLFSIWILIPVNDFYLTISPLVKDCAEFKSNDRRSWTVKYILLYTQFKSNAKMRAFTAFLMSSFIYLFQTDSIIKTMRTGLTFKCKFSIKWATPLFDKMSSLVAAKIDENNHDLAVSEQRMTSDDSCAGSSGNEDNNESKKRIKIIEEVYRPALRLMMLSGSYFGHTSFDKFQDTSSRPQKQCQLSRFYCFTVACCLWINFFMSVISIFYDGRDIYLLIMFAPWTLMVSLMGTTCLIVLPLTSSRRSRFQHFLLKLVTVHFEPEILRGIVSKAKLYANVFSIVVIFAIGAEIISDIFLDINIGTYEPWKRLRILTDNHSVLL